ncbi:MAG: rhodanese-like domain-containing protein [Alphaproteobacteria bacterium]|nr:rhodanese-like domain-containing protein [Alphaproteobacteria bacterium]MDX5415801.1 rhodanese-like domain-containing protein [Alphaproteobacteria bacterium]MDX5493071.1 rhodanese-like domain-containing protein [Alphaproteobacteria bacterium]
MSEKSEKGGVPEIVGAMPGNYAGDVTPAEAWRVLQENPDAVLVDVRTRAEWSFVGLPDLSAAGKEPVLMEWQLYPTMALNPGFVADLSSTLGQARKDAPVLFLCRSGARSRSAAIAMTGVGFGRCYNIAGGFEGDLDAVRHRGAQNGWKAADLPWAQS